MQEIWKTVITEDGIYEDYMVSNCGNIKSLNYNRTGKEKILSLDKDGIGYLHVTLYKNGKRKRYIVHRLVAMAFISNIENLPYIDHINTIKTDNRVENLRWCTHKQNMNNELTKMKQKERHHTDKTKNKISESHNKKVICLEIGKIFTSVNETSRQLEINATNIAGVCRGERRQTHNLTFRYLDQVLFYN